MRGWDVPSLWFRNRAMGLLILFGRIGGRIGLPIARAKTPNLLSKEAGDPVLGSPYPTTKASFQVLPGGIEEIPHKFFS